MQLIIIYDKTYILHNIENNYTISHIKSIIENKLHIPNDIQYLHFSGNQLSDNLTISDYNITNNSFIFLNEKLNGGNVKGFPNIGHLIILLGISTIALLLSYLFFDNIRETIYLIPKQTPCDPSLKNIESKLNLESTYNIFTNKKIYTGGTLPYNIINFLYTLSSMFYISIVIIILTIYIYTMHCNKNLTNWLVVSAIGSLIIIFIIFYILYKLVINKLLDVSKITYITTIAFTTLAIILIILSLIFPSINKNSIHLHWTTYLYPLGVIITVAIQYYTIKYTNWSLYIKTLILIIISSLFIFLPYTLAYIYNVYKICK